MADGLQYHIPYQSQADPNAFVAQGLSNFLTGLQQSQQWQGLIGGLGLPPQMAQALGGLRDPRMQQMGLGLAGQQMMNPLQQAQAQYYGARAQQAKQPSELDTSIETIEDPANPGQYINAVVNKQTGRVIASLGKATPREVAGTVQPGVLQKSTVAGLEKDIIELQSNLGELAQVEKDYDESFFTYRGKATSAITAMLEKAEYPISINAQDFLKKKTKFFADSKRIFLKFRKFITGVAGGIEEFREIAKATIDPEKDSPTQYLAKLDSMRDNAIRLSNLMLAMRNSGLNPRNKKNVKNAVSQISFRNVPLSVPANVTLETLGSQQKDQSGINDPLGLR